MYRVLAVELSLNAVIKFLVMSVMIDRLESFDFNINNVYKTVMMVAPMLITMLLGMRHMYPNPRLNGGLIAAAALLFVGCFLLVRVHWPVGDVQFLRSMIPHHWALG